MVFSPGKPKGRLTGCQKKFLAALPVPQSAKRFYGGQNLCDATLVPTPPPAFLFSSPPGPHLILHLILGTIRGDYARAAKSKSAGVSAGRKPILPREVTHKSRQEWIR